MYCADNDFCKRLSEETRNKLCMCCHMRMFGAGSVQMREDYNRFCTLILDGLLLSSHNFGRTDIDHINDKPALYVGFPGRLIFPNYDPWIAQVGDGYKYNNWYYPIDSWICTFEFNSIKELFLSDPTFSKAVLRSALEVQSDICQIAALFRANYTYYGVYHLLGILESYGLFLSQSKIAELMNHDRTAISKACSRLKQEELELWEAYCSNKKRVVTQPIRPDEAKKGRGSLA